MHVTTDNEALMELFTTGKSEDKRYRKLPKSTISGFVKAVNIIQKARRIEDLFQHKGLNYERLKGDLKEVELFEITDHYGSL